MIHRVDIDRRVLQVIACEAGRGPQVPGWRDLIAGCWTARVCRVECARVSKSVRAPPGSGGKANAAVARIVASVALMGGDGGGSRVDRRRLARDSKDY